MLYNILQYLKNEMEYKEGKIQFYKIKLLLLLCMIGIFIWNLTLSDYKPPIYWVLFSVIVVITLGVLILSYLGKRNYHKKLHQNNEE